MENELNNLEYNELINKFIKNRCCHFFWDYKKYFSRKIYNLFIKNDIFSPNENTLKDDYFCLGLFCKLKENYDLMKKYFLLAISLEDLNSMYELGDYYKNIEKNYDLMKKYCLQAIDKGCERSMLCLGNYYQDVEKNYDLSKKYFILLFKLNPHNFGFNYYNNVKILYLKLLIINDICELFCEKLNRQHLSTKNFEIYIDIIFDYLLINDNFYHDQVDRELLNIVFDKIDENIKFPNIIQENIIKNINTFLVTIGKILHSDKWDGNQNKKDEQIEEKRGIIKLKIDKIAGRSQFLKVVIKKYLKTLYYEYIENKYAPKNSGYLKAKKDFEMRSGSESGGKSEGIVNKIDFIEKNFFILKLENIIFCLFVDTITVIIVMFIITAIAIIIFIIIIFNHFIMNFVFKCINYFFNFFIFFFC
jgi:hypothetical protein